MKFKFIDFYIIKLLFNTGSANREFGYIIISKINQSVDMLRSFIESIKETDLIKEFLLSMQDEDYIGYYEDEVI